MRVAINDLSFQYSFCDRESALDALVRFLYLCQKVKEKRYHFVDKIQCDLIDRNFPLAPGQPFISLIQCLRQDQISLLLTLLVNSPFLREGEPFCIDDKVSYVCAYAREGILISLQSHPLFSSTTVSGCIGTTPVEIRNLSEEPHIEQYAASLGCRLYDPNPKHGKTLYRLGGHPVSPMPLDLEEAQKLLDQAIEIDGHLLAKQAGTYFEFRCHHDIYFHGYQNNALSEQIKRKLNAQWSLSQ